MTFISSNELVVLGNLHFVHYDLDLDIDIINASFSFDFESILIQSNTTQSDQSAAIGIKSGPKSGPHSSLF